MKRFFLFLSLFLVGTVQTTTVKERIAEIEAKNRTNTLIQQKSRIHDVKNKPLIAPKPPVISKKHVAAIVKTKQKIAPPVAPRSFKTRNLVIILNNDIEHVLEQDMLVFELVKLLAATSPNYTVLLSAEILQALLNKIQLLSAFLDNSFSAEEMINFFKIKDSDAYKIKEMKQYYSVNYPEIPDLDQIKNSNNLTNWILSNSKSNFLGRWTITKTVGNFYVLTPKNELSRFPFSQKHFTNQQNLTTFLETSPLEISPSIETQKKDTFKMFGVRFSKAASALLEKQPGKTPLPLNIVMTGHGNIDTAIAGIPLDTFKNFLKNTLSKTNTHSLYYRSCYGGGKNSITIFDTEFPFIVVAQGINETSIYDYIQMFELPSYFKNINSNFQKALNILRNGGLLNTPALENDFKVRLPGTTWFTPIEAHRNLQTISNTQARAAFLEKKPIQLTKRTCGLSTSVLPTLEVQPPYSFFDSLVFDQEIIGLVPFSNPKQEFYSIKKLVIHHSLKRLDIAQFLHTTFYTSSQRESTFFIEELKVKNNSYFNVIISKFFISFCEKKDMLPTFYTVPINELYQRGEVKPLLKPDQRELDWHTEITKRAHIIFNTYADNIKEYKKLHLQKHHKQDSPFALLKHRLETESFSKELENYANEVLESLSEVEQMVIKSVITAKKAL